MTKKTLIKRYFITGLLIWVPLVITVWVLNLLVTTMDQTLLLLPPALRTERWLGMHIPGLGVLLTRELAATRDYAYLFGRNRIRLALKR